MIVYRFKFDQSSIDTNQIQDLITYMVSCLVTNEDILNYKPSKSCFVVSCKKSNDKLAKLTEWIKQHVTYDFEYETITEDVRTLTQVKMQGSIPVLSIYYLLPLFPIESYLEL